MHALLGSLLPQTVRHPSLEVDLMALWRAHRDRYPGVMYSGCGGGYLIVASEEPVAGALGIAVRRRLSAAFLERYNPAAVSEKLDFRLRCRSEAHGEAEAEEKGRGRQHQGSGDDERLEPGHDFRRRFLKRVVVEAGGDFRRRGVCPAPHGRAEEQGDVPVDPEGDLRFAVESECRQRRQRSRTK